MVTVFEIVEQPDGTKAIGNSLEMSLADAIEAIEVGEVTSGIAPMGVVPAEWGEGE